jgi:hypothetical protein
MAIGINVDREIESSLHRHLDEVVRDSSTRAQRVDGDVDVSFVAEVVADFASVQEDTIIDHLSKEAS